jgi:hypothetical protein
VDACDAADPASLAAAAATHRRRQAGCSGAAAPPCQVAEAAAAAVVVVVVGCDDTCHTSRESVCVAGGRQLVRGSQLLAGIRDCGLKNEQHSGGEWKTSKVADDDEIFKKAPKIASGPACGTYRK